MVHTVIPHLLYVLGLVVGCLAMGFAAVLWLLGQSWDYVFGFALTGFLFALLFAGALPVISGWGALYFMGAALVAIVILEVYAFWVILRRDDSQPPTACARDTVDATVAAIHRLKP